MKTNKKLISIIIALLVAFGSVACAKASEQEVAPTISQIETPKEETVLKQEETKEEKAADEKAAAEKAAAEKAAAEKAAAEKAAAEKAAAEKAAAEKAAAEKAAAEKAAAEKAAAEKAAAEKAAAEKAAAEKAQQQTQQQSDDMPLTADANGNLLDGSGNIVGSAPQSQQQYDFSYNPSIHTGNYAGKLTSEEAVYEVPFVVEVIRYIPKMYGWEVITDTGRRTILMNNGTAMDYSIAEMFFPDYLS